jgi:hypothetical protein
VATDDVAQQLGAITKRFAPVLVIIAPPRSASTAVSRVLWMHEAFGWDSHEPFEPRYYRQQSLIKALESVSEPRAIDELSEGRGARKGRGLIVKEMSFQVGVDFQHLVLAASLPVVFLVRDPRLTITSRQHVLARHGRRAGFPHRESGWTDLEWQIDYVRGHDIPYTVCDTTALRAQPDAQLPALFASLGLTYTSELLDWRPATVNGLSSVWGDDDPFYERVLRIVTLEAPSEPIPELGCFSAESGLRSHVTEALRFYHALRGQIERT